MKTICCDFTQTKKISYLLGKINLNQNNSYFNIHKPDLPIKNNFSLHKQLIWILGALLLVFLSGCFTESDPEELSPDTRLNCAEGEILKVILHYGEALNADGGGSYSVELKNPRSNWRDIVIWETAWSHKNVKEKDRKYTFTFYDDNFYTQYEDYNYHPGYKTWDQYVLNEISGSYNIIIRNSFGDEIHSTASCGIYANVIGCNIIFDPGVREFNVP